jgi:hypothetical protein
VIHQLSSNVAGQNILEILNGHARVAGVDIVVDLARVGDKRSDELMDVAVRVWLIAQSEARRSWEEVYLDGDPAASNLLGTTSLGTSSCCPAPECPTPLTDRLEGDILPRIGSIDNSER